MHGQRVLKFVVLVVALTAVAEARWRHRQGHRRQRPWGQNIRVQIPNFRVPTRRLPRVQIPDVRVQEVKVPKVETPNYKVRIVPVPDVKVPDIQIQDFKAPNIPIPNIPEIHVPEIDDWNPDVGVPDIQLRDFKAPEIPIPDIPEIHVPEINVPQFQVPDFPSRDEILRPAMELLRQFRNGRFSDPFSKQKDRDWQLTWGWFNTKDVRSEVRPRPEPVHDQGAPFEAGIGAGREEYQDPFGSTIMDWPRWRHGNWPFNRPTFPRPGLSSTFFHDVPHRHHRPHRPVSRPPSRPVGAKPSYDRLCRGRHYSARRYQSTTWIGAPVVNGTSMDTLRRIKEYFNGQNNQGRVMLMSRPLRMTVTGVNGSISDTEDTLEEFRLSAMVPLDNQGRVPTPNDPMLSITTESSQVYFVTHFRHDRRPGTPAIYDEFFELQDALELAGESFEQGIYHSAFYETWADIASGSTRPHIGEILIPAASGENLVCARQETRTPQNGIEQCGDSRCPDYEHLEQLRDDVEHRRVKGATYVTRKAPACTLVLPAFVSHCALKRYLAGANSEGQRYPSPAPFIHYVRPSQRASSFCKQTAISAYVLPPNTTAAEPTERDLRIFTLPDREAFVIKFGGRPDGRTVERKVDELRDFLKQQGLCFVRDRYVVAVYDHPFNRPPHLNEVLIFKKRGPCRKSDEGDAVSTIPTSSMSSMTTEGRETDERLLEEEFEPSTETIEQVETTSVRSTTREPNRESTSKTTTENTTENPPLIEVNLTLESNSVEDLIPYRFSGNQTDFPEDFPVDVFVF